MTPRGVACWVSGAAHDGVLFCSYFERDIQLEEEQVLTNFARAVRFLRAAIVVVWCANVCSTCRCERGDEGRVAMGRVKSQLRTLHHHQLLNCARKSEHAGGSVVRGLHDHAGGGTTRNLTWATCTRCARERHKHMQRGWLSACLY